MKTTMRSNKKLPFTIIKTPLISPKQKGSLRTSSDLSYEPKVSERELVGKRSPQDNNRCQAISYNSDSKSPFNIIRQNSAPSSEAIQKYIEDKANYCEDGFTSRSESFLSKIATSKNIPQKIKSNFPLQSALMAITKMFMLNENEIVLLACSLDHYGWKVDQAVSAEESEFLIEFPNTVVENLTNDYKRLIIYLMLITFSIKQQLNPKGQYEHIEVYCNSLCPIFSSLINKWAHITPDLMSSLSFMDINLKFNELNQQDYLNNSSNINYNMIADNIITLSGCYKSKIANEDHMPALKDSIFTSISAKLISSPSNSVSTFIETVDHKSMFTDATPITSLQNFESDSYFPKFDKISYTETADSLTLNEKFQRGSSLDMIGDLREEFGMKQMRLNSGQPVFVNQREGSLSRQISGANGHFNNFNMDDYFADHMTYDKGNLNHAYNQKMSDEDLYLTKYNNSWYQD